MQADEQLMWGSHLPVLAACLAATSGDVLELGVGDFSTPFLHAYCGAAGRKLVSVESDAAWVEKVGPRFGGQSHRFYCGDYDTLALQLAAREWAVVLIDNSPGGARRAQDFSFLRHCAQFVVVHDYWQDNEEHIAPMLNGINYYVCHRQKPPTLVASMQRPIPYVIFNL